MKELLDSLGAAIQAAGKVVAGAPPAAMQTALANVITESFKYVADNDLLFEVETHPTFLPVKYSADWLRELVDQRGIEMLDTGHCTNNRPSYITFAAGVPFLGCGCTPTPKRTTWHDVAAWLDRLPDDAARDRALGLIDAAVNSADTAAA